MTIFEVDEKNLQLKEERLCLDFANTADWHAAPRPSETLTDYTALVAWARRVDLVDEQEEQQLLHLAEAQPDAAGSALADAVMLREAIYRLFSATGGRRAFEQADLDLLNRWVSDAAVHREIVRLDTGFASAWLSNGAELTWLLWPIAVSAGRLLLSEERERVKECEDDRGCGYLFLDTSHNRSRRWCTMESCGNRAKVRRHRQKTHENK
jgi:predicted RNA-binding Zn ribbon-like protein